MQASTGTAQALVEHGVPTGPQGLPTVLHRLPTELVQEVVWFLPQKDLLSLSLASRYLRELAANILYRRIYLNDTRVEASEEYLLAPNWSWLEVKCFAGEAESEADVETRSKQCANGKLRSLIRALSSSPGLCNKVVEVRLNWDLDINLQMELIEVLVNRSQSLRIIENVTDPRLNSVILRGRYVRNLVSLDLPPPNTLPSIDISRDYLADLQQCVAQRLQHGLASIKVLIIFMNPLLLFNNVYRLRPGRKFQIASLKIHYRADFYPEQVYSRANRTLARYSDVFDVRYLRVLTIISWHEQILPESTYDFAQWHDFTQLEDITLIAVTFDDPKIARLIERAHCLKRLKLDFFYPRRSMATDSLTYKAIFHQRRNLRFLDLKLALNVKIVNLDVRRYRIKIKIPCKCSLCQDRVLKGIFESKILPTDDDYFVQQIENYEIINFFDQLFMSNLLPYSKAVDAYPSVETGSDSIESFLARFNSMNAERSSTFVPLDTQDFYDLFHCLIHNLKHTLAPFVTEFPQLKFLVLNDISFLIKDGSEFRYPVPLFFSTNYQTNFTGKDDDEEDDDEEDRYFIRSLLFLN